MNQHFRYLSYVARHKWHVFRACAQRGLLWRGLTHDWHKLLPSEFFPYADFFYGEALWEFEVVSAESKVPLFKDTSGAAPFAAVVVGSYTRASNSRCVRDESGYYKPTDSGDPKFDHAWLLHTKRADHHWQFWTLADDAGGMKILPMPTEARLEMVCDWIGASMAQGHGGLEGVRKWYTKNHSKMQLHPETCAWVEDFLNLTIEPARI